MSTLLQEGASNNLLVHQRHVGPVCQLSQAPRRRMRMERGLRGPYSSFRLLTAQDSAECLKGTGGAPADESGCLTRWVVAILTGG